MKKRFGIEIRETDKGFTVEFNGDEETLKARREAADAWRDFVKKAKKAVRQAHESHFHTWHEESDKEDGAKE